MTKNLKAGDKVVLIGTLLGNIVAAEAGEILALGQGTVAAGLSEVEVFKVRLECGDVVSVPANHVHIPS